MSEEDEPVDERADDAHDLDAEADPFAELAESETGADDSDPFEELDDAPLGERTPATDDDLFEEVDREALDAEDEIVERVLDGEDVDGALAPDEVAGGDTETPPARDEVVVPKRRYCEGCQYFTAPPETACEHPGTDILELVDAEHFLVADCPVVEWRRELEAYPDPGEASTDPRD